MLCMGNRISGPYLRPGIRFLHFFAQPTVMIVYNFHYSFIYCLTYLVGAPGPCDQVARYSKNLLTMMSIPRVIKLVIAILQAVLPFILNDDEEKSE